MKNIKIFCGYSNTGGIAFKIADGLRKNSFSADSIIIDENEFKYEYHKKLDDYSNRTFFIGRFLKYYYFIKHLIKYDVFIFTTRSTLLSRKWDLRILRFLGKKTSMIYVGCDIRDKSYYLNIPDKFTACKNCTPEYQKKIGCVMEIKQRDTNYIQKYVNASFSHPFDAQILKGNYSYLYLLLELEKYSPNYTVNNKVKILHAPSDTGIKGTKYVIDAINKLRSENVDFDFELLTGKTNPEIIEAIRNCDILIDQVVAGWYGLISIEAMALGKTVVCYIKDELYSYLPDLPIRNLNPDNLINGLKKLINDRDQLSKSGKLGRQFVEKYHDHVKNSAMILKRTIEVKYI